LRIWERVAADSFSVITPTANISTAAGEGFLPR
jgi:hypothetical protein